MTTTLRSRPATAVFIAVSLDGFIARPDGSLDWLMQAQAAAPAGEDFGYADFMADVDALLMGRKTLETVLGFTPWPYAGKAVHALTRQTDWAPTEAPGAPVQLHRDGPAAVLARLAAAGVRKVYLDGGELIQSCLRDDLVDEMTLTVVPLLLGQGRPLWGALPADLGWQLASSRHWPCGFVQSRYRRDAAR